MAAAERICAVALQLDGSITGEHGVGELKMGWLRQAAGLDGPGRAGVHPAPRSIPRGCSNPAAATKPGAVFSGSSANKNVRCVKVRRLVRSPLQERSFPYGLRGHRHDGVRRPSPLWRTAMPSLPARTDVLIVGAGPVGLALACALTQLGVDHVVIDRNEGPQPGSRAAGIQPGTLEYLDPPRAGQGPGRGGGGAAAVSSCTTAGAACCGCPTTSWTRGSRTCCCCPSRPPRSTWTATWPSGAAWCTAVTSCWTTAWTSPG